MISFKPEITGTSGSEQHNLPARAPCLGTRKKLTVLSYHGWVTKMNENRGEYIACKVTRVVLSLYLLTKLDLIYDMYEK